MRSVWSAGECFATGPRALGRVPEARALGSLSSATVGPAAGVVRQFRAGQSAIPDEGFPRVSRPLALFEPFDAANL